MGNSSFLVTTEAPPEDEGGDSYTFKEISKRLNVILPVDPTQADVLTPQVSERGQDLVQEFRQGISRHPEWWIEYSQQNRPTGGDTLPYHPNMGISEAEYEEMGALLDGMTMVKSAEVTLFFVNRGNGRVEVSSQELRQLLRDLEVDFRNDIVVTPIGILERSDDINNLDPNAPTGPWSGPSWKLEAVSGQPPFGTIAQFALGRRSVDGRGVLYFKVRRVLPGQEPQKIDLFLVYGAAR